MMLSHRVSRLCLHATLVAPIRARVQLHAQSCCMFTNSDLMIFNVVWPFFILCLLRCVVSEPAALSAGSVQLKGYNAVP